MISSKTQGRSGRVIRARRSAVAFLVDREGLAKLMARRPRGYVILELLQNAWDEDISHVNVTLTHERGRVTIVVEDDAPEGFADLAHAYTLFAESQKKADPTKRGRFNLGEKLVIAISETAQINTTKGTIRFDKRGRTHSRQRRLAGTIFTATLRMTRQEFQGVLAVADQVIPPSNIVTVLNGAPLPVREPLASFEIALPTEIADADGYLRRTIRKTMIGVYEPREGESAMLYEMGIPIVETGDTWHVDIGQKVPLNADRDNVTPAYLRQVRTAVLNQLAGRVPDDEATAVWIAVALEDRDVRPEAVATVLNKRFGPKRVVADPSDREAEKRAVAAGYTVIPSRAFNAAQWENIRAAKAALPAGRVTPSPKPFTPEGSPLPGVPPERWPDGVAGTVARINDIAERLTNGEVQIVIVNDLGWPFAGACGPDCKLYLNVGRLGWRWFKGVGERQLSLLIHELAHIFVGDHLSDGYADNLCDLGARLALLAVDHPELLSERRGTKVGVQ